MQDLIGQGLWTWTALKFEQIFVEKARIQGLDIHTIANIKLKWKKDGSDEE